MSNALYNLGRNAFLGPATGQINWTNDTIYAALVEGSYAFSNSHQYVSDVTGNGGTIPSNGRGQITSTTATAGVANGANVTFTAVPAGPAINYIIIYKYNAVDSAAQLIAFIDTALNLPVTPNGGNITISWDTGANKIFSI